MSDTMPGPRDDLEVTDPTPSEVGAVRTDTDQTDDTKEEAKARADDVKHTARQERQRVQEEAKAQTRNLVHQVTGQLRDQAESQTTRVADFLATLSDQAHALTEGRVDEAGQLGQYAQQIGDETGRLAQTIEDRGFQGLLDDVQRFARRRPAVFLLSAAAAGVAVGRLGRGAKDAGPSSSNSQPAGQLPAATSGTDVEVEVDVETRADRPVGTVPPAAAAGALDEAGDPTGRNVIAPDPERVATETRRFRG